MITLHLHGGPYDGRDLEFPGVEEPPERVLVETLIKVTDREDGRTIGYSGTDSRQARYTRVGVRSSVYRWDPTV